MPDTIAQYCVVGCDSKPPERGGQMPCNFHTPEEELRCHTDLVQGAEDEIRCLRQANQRLLAENAHLKTLAAEVQRMLRHDRERAARILHDGVAQDLAVLLLKMEIVARLAATDPERTIAEISKVTALLESCVGRVRSAAHELRDSSDS